MAPKKTKAAGQRKFKPKLNTSKLRVASPVRQKLEPLASKPTEFVRVVEGAKKLYNATDMPLSAVGSNYTIGPGQVVDVSLVPGHLLNFWKEVRAVEER